MKGKFTMYTIRYYMTMWVLFNLLFFGATAGLELLEGNKIRTTEYVGLNNIGIIFIIYIALILFVAYPILLLPLTIIINKFVKPLSIRVIIFTVCSGIFGVMTFYSLYGDFIADYDLKKSSAIIIYGIAGLLYALIDSFFRRKDLELQYN